jgi:ABC-type branched-subunit amino acid transport system permease subunit
MATINSGYPQASGILALDMAVHAGIGASAATMSGINPIVGMTFAIVYFAGSHGANFLEQWMDDKGCNPFNNHTTFAKATRFAIAFFAGIATASTVCTMLGTPIIFSSGLYLTSAMLATTATIATFVYNHSLAQDVILGPDLLSALRC